MFKFEWGVRKAASNLRKHGVSFDEAVSVFADGLALTFTDTDHYESEDRSRTYTDSQTEDGFSWWFTRSAARMFESSALERRPDMKKTSTKKDEQFIPELKREQLGAGVRGKYFKKFAQASNMVVLRPEIQKVFPDSEAVNKALASMLAFAQETQGLAARSKRSSRKRAAA